MSSQRVSQYQDRIFRFRNSSVAIAVMAGGIGLICGALAVWTSGPVVSPAKTALKPAVETTGSAPKSDPEMPVNSASVADCDAQSWPYITQQCLSKREASQRKVRVITTDKVADPVVTAIEAERVKEPVRTATEPPRAVEPGIAEQTVPVAAPEPKSSEPPVVVSAFDPRFTAVSLEPVVPTDMTADAGADPLPASAPLPAPRPQQVVHSQTRAKALNRDQRKLTAKPRRTPVQEARIDTADDGPRPAQGRLVERWTEREYHVPSDAGAQRRRVIVRSDAASEGPFGALFGSVFR